MDVRSNRLLAGLSDEALDWLTRDANLIAPPFSTVLIEQELPTQNVYFPLPGAVVSVTRSVADGTIVEVGVIGSEGLAGIAAVFDPRRHLDRAVVQAEGKLLQVPVGVIEGGLAESAEVRRMIFLYTNLFLVQVTQTALCNRLHVIEQRLARWILMMRDRTASDELRLTQEFLSHMLGARIAGVNEAVQSLERAGLIAHSRQRIRVIDRARLEEASCECYRVVRAEFERLSSSR